MINISHCFRELNTWKFVPYLCLEISSLIFQITLQRVQRYQKIKDKALNPSTDSRYMAHGPKK